MEVDGATAPAAPTQSAQTVSGMDILSGAQSTHGGQSGGSTADMDDVTTASGTTLKRCNSAPMINLIATNNVGTHVATNAPQTFPDVQMRERSNTVSHSLPNVDHHNSPLYMAAFNNRPGEMSRIRRYSTGAQGMHSPGNRLNQLKYEEQGSREIDHERETQNTMAITNCWEGWKINDSSENKKSSVKEPLHIFTTPFPYGGSPSPTRVGKQCFSPALQQPIMKNTTLSPSPSPTRNKFASRRSISPIAIRPSRLSGFKRKMEIEDSDRMDTQYGLSPKRFHHYSSAGNSTPERCSSIAHPLAHSISSSSLDEGIVADHHHQRMSSVSSHPSSATTSSSAPGSLAHTPASAVPGATSATTCFGFRPVRDSVDTLRTDSESSDMIEPTDISDHCDMNTDAAMPAPVSAPPAVPMTSVATSPLHSFAAHHNSHHSGAAGDVAGTGATTGAGPAFGGHSS